MGYFKFEFWPIGSFRCIEGVFGLESEEASDVHSLLDRHSDKKQIWVCGKYFILTTINWKISAVDTPCNSKVKCTINKEKPKLSVYS
jgi:hypothetical protein